MPNEIDNITLCGTQIELSEDKSDPDIYRAKFLISGFGVNKNNVQLDREHIEEWLSTLVDKPVVGRVSLSSDGKMDFESHNLRIVTKKKNGKTYKEAEFDTTPFGHFTSASIETAEDGNEYIYADAVLYKRYKNAIGVLERRMADNETVSTSWEIAVEKSSPKVENGEIVKVITKGRFLAHCFLGANIEPAYDESGLLQVAEKTEQELNVALSQDCINISESSDITNTDDKEVKVDMGKDNVIEANVSTENTEEEEIIGQSTETDIEEMQQKKVDNSVCKKDDDDEKTKKSECEDDDNDKDDGDNKQKSEVEKSEDNTETSALTDNDLRHKLDSAFEQPDANGRCTYGYLFMLFPADNIAWFREYGRNTETELVEVKYTVENDAVIITERNPVVLTVSPREINQVIAQKDSAIVEMSAQIQTLNDKVAELQPYKDKVDEIEKAEREAQLEKDKKELSDYAISSGYITKEEVETSEEIKGYIDNLDKASIKSLIADRVVASLSQKESEVETSESKTEPNVQINLSAEQVDKNKTTKDAEWIVKAYIGR